MRRADCATVRRAARVSEAPEDLAGVRRGLGPPRRRGAGGCARDGGSRTKVKGAATASAGKGAVPVNRSAQQTSAGASSRQAPRRRSRRISPAHALIVVIAILCRHRRARGRRLVVVAQTATASTGTLNMKLDWKDLAQTVIGLGAPMLGLALGGPLGGAAGKILADALGAATATPAGVSEAIVSHNTDAAFIAKRRGEPRANGWQRWPRSARRRSPRSARRSAPRSSATIRCSAGGVRFTRWSFRCSNVRPSL